MEVTTMIANFARLARSEPAMLVLTLAAYVAAQLLYRKWRSPALHPLITSTALVVGVLLLMNVGFETYYEANRIVNFMLGLSVVSLGYLLYDNLSQIRRRAVPVMVSILAGSVVGLLSVILLAKLMCVDSILIVSLSPKSVTAPIAIILSGNSGGVPAIISISVIITGIFGSMVAAPVFKALRITDSVAKGAALGTSAHAVGTARAMEIGVLEGAVSGACIGLTGIITAALMPLLGFLL